MKREEVVSEFNDKLQQNSQDFEEKREQELVTLIANIIVEKVLKHDGQKGNPLSEVQQ
jgi:hypothetical protein